MQLDPSHTGTALRDHLVTVSWRHMMNYAAAVNDPNEAYFDDEGTGGIIAHPMFCTALTWPISGHIWEYIESADFPRELLATQVHFTEHLEIHRPIVPGDDLLIRGCIAAIAPHRRGTQVIIRFSAADRDGRPVFTEHVGGLLRGVSCAGEAVGLEQVPRPRRRAASQVQWESLLPISAMAPFVYDGCTNIVFPIHTSRNFARQVGLPGIILQGTATLALAVRELINREAEGDPRRIKEIHGKFTGMVSPGTEIRIQQVGAERSATGRDILFAVENRDGQLAINDGYVRIEA